MDPIDFPVPSDTPYRLPSRHPSAARGDHGSADGNGQAETEAPPAPATTATRAAADIKRRQESLLLTYLIHQPGRY
jgi:hypothetical protein